MSESIGGLFFGVIGDGDESGLDYIMQAIEKRVIFYAFGLEIFQKYRNENMKEHWVFLTTLSFCLSMTAYSQSVKESDASMYEKLVNLKFEEYIGSELNKFLNDFDPKYKKYTPIFLKPGYVSYVGFSYGDSIWLVIRVKHLKQDSPMPTYVLDIENYKKKKVDEICFKYAGRCIKGCEAQPCQ